MQQNNLLAEAMKLGMRQLASGVCIIAIEDHLGERHAMTATSVTSVSDSPASLLACVNKMHRINSAFEQGAHFSVNVLSQLHQDLSNICADSALADKRFASPVWRFDANKAPWLSDALAVFHCRCEKTVSYGTHDIVIGQILEAQASSNKQEYPLVYYNGGYSVIS